MMAFLRQYVLSVVAAALLCSIVSGLTRGSKAKELLRLLCGIFLAVTALQPLLGFDIDEWLKESFPYREEAKQSVALGEDLARSAKADIIKEKTEAYILDKAAALNTNLTVEVSVCQEGEPVPERMVIRGQISPYAKGRLETILLEDLGIAKENQVWTG